MSYQIFTVSEGQIESEELRTVKIQQSHVGSPSVKIFSVLSSSAVVENFEKRVYMLYSLILGEHKYNHHCRRFSRSGHGKSWSHSEIFDSLECSSVNSSSGSQPD